MPSPRLIDCTVNQGADTLTYEAVVKKAPERKRTWVVSVPDDAAHAEAIALLEMFFGALQGKAP